MPHCSSHSSPRFPFLFGRAFIEAPFGARYRHGRTKFPFLFGRAFIEAPFGARYRHGRTKFPFLFGRAFIEALNKKTIVLSWVFPFLFGRAFIEAEAATRHLEDDDYFPSFLEGLSLRHSP